MKRRTTNGVRQHSNTPEADGQPNGRPDPETAHRITDPGLRRLIERAVGDPELVRSAWTDEETADRTYGPTEVRYEVARAVALTNGKPGRAFTRSEVRALLIERFGPRTYDGEPPPGVPWCRYPHDGEDLFDFLTDHWGDLLHPPGDLISLEQLTEDLASLEEIEAIEANAQEDAAKPKPTTEPTTEDEKKPAPEPADGPNGAPDLLGTDDAARTVWWQTLTEPSLPPSKKPAPSTLQTAGGLLRYMAGNGSGAWPSAGTLARAIGRHRATVERHLADLRARGFLRRTRRFKRPDQGYEYQATLPDDEEIAEVARRWRGKMDEARCRRAKRRGRRKGSR